MSEQSVASARASVLVYDSNIKKWVPSGSSSGIAKVHIYHHIENNTFRVVGRKVQDHEVVINSSIYKGLKYFQATPTFHQWRDNSQIHGLNFASRDDAETFALAMERCIDILGHSSNQRSSQNQPLYQTIGHSGVSLDDYAEYRGWMNNENGERKQASEYGHYRTSHATSSNHSSHPNTPGQTMPSPIAYSRANSAPPPVAQQQLAAAQTPVAAAPPPPPPPPPPPSAGHSISGAATLPRLHLKTDEQEPNETSLAAALAMAKLKKTPAKSNDATANEAKPFQMKGMACMLDEMTRTLARRRAQTDSNLDTGSCGSGDSNMSRHNSASACSPGRNSEGESPQSIRRSDMDSDGKIVVDMYQIEKMKQDLLNEMKVEMNKIKQDIIDAIRMELNRR
ncbi:hypothetical protein JTE90_003787 [Oedothorax gibbosus]|uniref:WH1 domain-containing protein n=1 Tax=Oedothorax gibbosus TaxID=931172 RepID=A0AAV6V9B7_9ARAC|nr:hypothetical protein JTE90_003787 [Oedothorax gibbosus]